MERSRTIATKQNFFTLHCFVFCESTKSLKEGEVDNGFVVHHSQKQALLVVMLVRLKERTLQREGEVSQAGEPRVTGSRDMHTAAEFRTIYILIDL